MQREINLGATCIFEVLTCSPEEDEIVDPPAMPGELPIHEFFDPLGFAQRRTRAKRLSAAT